MRLIRSVAAGLLIVGVFSRTGSGQDPGARPPNAPGLSSTNQPKGAGVTSPPTSLSSPPRSDSLVAGQQPQAPLTGPSRKPALSPLFPSSLQQSNGMAKLSRGVYLTSPYTCLVVVPGEHIDDRCVRSIGNPDPAMPVVKPSLKLIPYPPP